MSIFSLIESFSSYNILKSEELFSKISLTISANSSPPSPPFSQTLHNATFTPFSSQNSSINLISASLSLTNLFIATTTGTLYFCIFSICFSKFTTPFLSASTFSSFKSALATPPWCFNALIVATITIHSGFKSPYLHFISKNFSAPKSAPKPASVITTSPKVIAIFVAIIELHPWAILAKGPPWIIAGVFSKVCTKFGLMASFINNAIAPWTSNCFA